MKAIWQMIKSAVLAIFSRETVSKVWSILFSGAKTTVSEILADQAIMDAAYDYCAALATSDATSDAKRATFNALMGDYLVSQGKTVGTAMLNAIRETAYAAVLASKEQ